MKEETLPPTLTLEEGSPETSSTGEDVQRHWQGVVKRRSFLTGLGMTGAALSAGALLPTKGMAQTTSSSGRLSPGDVALLQFALWAELVDEAASGIGNKNIAKGIGGNAGGLIEMPGLAALHAPGVQVLQRRRRCRPRGLSLGIHLRAARQCQRCNQHDSPGEGLPSIKHSYESIPIIAPAIRRSSSMFRFVNVFFPERGARRRLLKPCAPWFDASGRTSGWMRCPTNLEKRTPRRHRGLFLI